MEELKTEIKQIKNQILVGIKEDKIEYTWGKMIVDTCDKALTLHGVGWKSEQSTCKHDYATFGLKEPRKRWCVKCGKDYSFAG